jgi:hypothetical protein
MELFISIVAILMSGVVACVVTYRLNTTKDHVFFMRQKAEQLFLATEKYDKDLGTNYIQYYQLLKGEISYNGFLDLNNDWLNKNKNMGACHEQMSMLTLIYFPSLEKHLENYTNARDAVNKIIADHKRAYKTGEDGEEFLQPFNEALGELIRQAETLKASIVTEARRFATTETFWPESLKWKNVISKLRPFIRSGTHRP